jgi:hypothetical protein
MFKILLVGALLVSALASASSAAATSWSTNGPLNYTASAPPAKWALDSPSNPLTICTNVSATGSVASGLGAMGSTFDAGPITHRLANCTIAGLVATVACSGAHLIAESEAGPVISGHWNSFHCTITRGACVITVTGSIPLQYDNTTGIFTVFAAGQSLLASAPAACNSWTGFTSASGGVAPFHIGSNSTPIGNLAYTVTSTPRPAIDRLP